MVKYLCSGKMAVRFSKQENDQKRAVYVYQKVIVVYRNLQVNGPWFLWKLYASEVFEAIQQCINLGTVYLCSLPV